jgi:hypothetical protein
MTEETERALQWKNEYTMRTQPLQLRSADGAGVLGT